MEQPYLFLMKSLLRSSFEIYLDQVYDYSGKWTGMLEQKERYLWISGLQMG
jgi:hypothetical protein